MMSKASPEYYQEFLFPSSSITQQPSTVDSAQPAIYSRRVLIFSSVQPENQPQHDRSRTIQILRDAMEKTIQEFPILSNSISFASGEWRFLPGKARLHVRELPLTFKELEDTNFSHVLLKPDVLSSVPGMIDFENAWDCCRVQANFIEGGLLISVCICHLAMDGVAITNVVQALARNTCVPSKPAPEKSPTAFDRSRLSMSNSIPDITRMPAYLILTEAFDFASRMIGRISSKTYIFSEASLAELKKDSLSSLLKGQWVSTQDVVCALIYQKKIKARLAAGILKEDDEVQYSFPVEYRSIIEPPLPSDFVGNAVIFTATPFVRVADLISAPGLSLAAASIRTAIQDVDAEFVDNAIAVIKSLPDSRTFNFYGAIYGKTTAICSTTYKSFIMPDEWHEAIGKYELMRLMSGAFGDGMFVVMPIRDRAWEVVVTLAEDAMENFEDDEWNRYAVRG